MPEFSALYRKLWTQRARRASFWLMFFSVLDANRAGSDGLEVADCTGAACDTGARVTAVIKKADKTRNDILQISFLNRRLFRLCLADNLRLAKSVNTRFAFNRNLLQMRGAVRRYLGLLSRRDSRAVCLGFGDVMEPVIQKKEYVYERTKACCVVHPRWLGHALG